MQHDLAQKIDCVYQQVRSGGFEADVRLGVLMGQCVLPGKAGFELVALADKLVELASRVPRRVLFNSADGSVPSKSTSRESHTVGLPHKTTEPPCHRSRES